METINVIGYNLKEDTWILDTAQVVSTDELIRLILSKNN